MCNEKCSWHTLSLQIFHLCVNHILFTSSVNFVVVQLPESTCRRLSCGHICLTEFYPTWSWSTTFPYLFSGTEGHFQIRKKTEFHSLPITDRLKDTKIVFSNNQLYHKLQFVPVIE